MALFGKKKENAAALGKWSWVAKLKWILVFIWILVVAVAYLIMLPPINVNAVGFWAFFIPALFAPVFLIVQVSTLSKGFNKGKGLWPVYVVIVCVAVYLLGSLIFSPVFNSKFYINRISIQNADFVTDIKEVDFDNLPLLDKDSSQKVGDRVVGQISDLVSQFRVSDEYSLINYKGKSVRVTPLEHTDLYKYLSNHNGTAGYVIVDTTTGEATMVRTQSGLKYLPSAYFLHDLHRHARLHYPFDNFGDISFEIDEQGQPFWIIQTLKYTWVGLKPQVSGVIAINAIDGKCEKYPVKDVPAWIDNVYDANLVIKEIDSWGLYRNGYINSLFAQKDVVQTTDGYTYITRDDDVYMYTGITSVSNDESNIGFVMVNLRTHQADYYAVPGAEEYSAMDTAVGAVQEKNYTTTFPLLINLAGKPTYLLSLKDNAGLVKMYAFVDVNDYQKVCCTDSSLGIKKAADEYLKLFGDNTIPEEKIFAKTITIASIKEVVVDGNTYYYITDSEFERYQLKASIDLTITPYINENDMYRIRYYNDGRMNIIVEIGV